MKWLKSSSAAAAFLASVLLTSSTLKAGELKYSVRKGQSLSLICREVYGDEDLYTLVALYNGKDNPKKISAGEVIRLPYSDMVILKEGESLSSLARRVWKDAKKYHVIAWANGIRNPAIVPAGTRLAVPALVPYRLPAGESVSSVAQRFYGDYRQYGPIMYASGIEDPARVPAGSLLMVPYLFPKPEVKSEPHAGGKMSSSPVSDKALALLGKAEAAYRSGKYGDAWTAGYEASKELNGTQKAKALRLLAACQYAFRRMDEALDDLKTAYELDPDFRPDPVYVNPEMMELYQKAREK
jgi:hypothetical protein